MSNNQNLPIVLAHGIARFDVLLEILRKKSNLPDTQLSDRFQYFKGIKTHLEAHGFRVFHPNQDFAGSVDVRAEQLNTGLIDSDFHGEVVTRHRSGSRSG